MTEEENDIRLIYTLNARVGGWIAGQDLLAAKFAGAVDESEKAAIFDAKAPAAAGSLPTQIAALEAYATVAERIGRIDNLREVIIPSGMAQKGVTNIHQRLEQMSPEVAERIFGGDAPRLDHE